MWPRQGSVLTVSSRAMLGACARLGIDTDALLTEVGVSRVTIDDPDGRLDGVTAAALWSRAYRLSGDPVLSLHAAEACPRGAYKVIDYMAFNASTVGEGFRFAARYFPLINTAVRLPIDESGDPVRVDIVTDDGAASVSQPYAEYCFAAFVLRVRSESGVDFPLRSLAFAHAAPADAREHERLFRCPVRFGTGRHRLEVDREAWETPTTRGDPGVFQVLLEHAELLLERLPRGPDLVERTRRTIGERLRGGDSAIESVARAMGTSGRSLQRHLRDLGYTYQSLADEVREATARLYLAQPDIAIAEVAFLLGYSDTPTFNRAFKRWTGRTPARMRAELTGRVASPEAGTEP
jgi:AraC-like DNA-binding protein